MNPVSNPGREQGIALTICADLFSGPAIDLDAVLVPVGTTARSCYVMTISLHTCCLIIER